MYSANEHHMFCVKPNPVSWLSNKFVTFSLILLNCQQQTSIFFFKQTNKRVFIGHIAKLTIMYGTGVILPQVSIRRTPF